MTWASRVRLVRVASGTDKLDYCSTTISSVDHGVISLSMMAPDPKLQQFRRRGPRMPPQRSAIKVPEATSSATNWLWSIKSYRPSLPGTRPTCRRPPPLCHDYSPYCPQHDRKRHLSPHRLAARYALPDLLCLSQDSPDFTI